MTSQAQRNAGYLLPETVTGHELIRVCLCIPNDPFHRAAFLGAIYELTKPWNWQALDESEYPRQQEAARYWTLLYHEYLKMPCNICELIAECLENLEPGSALYDALHNWLVGQLTNEADIQNILNQGGAGGTASPLSSQAMITQCDQALLFGFTRQLVQQLNRMIVDLYEILEVYTNFTEFLAAVTSETSFLGAAIEYAEKLQDTFMENYTANYTISLENEYACDLMCLAINNDCVLSWELLTNYFLGRLFTELGDNTVFDILSYFVSGVWTGAEFCHLSMAVICSVLHFSGEWLGFNLGDIQNLWNSWLNDPDEDWSTLCDTCAPAPWTVRYDFERYDSKGWTVDVGWWTSGDYLWSGPEPQPGGHYLQVSRYFEAFDGLKQFQFPNVLIGYSGQSNVNLHVVITHDGGTVEYGFPYTGAGSANVYFDPPLNHVTYIQAVAREDYVGDGGFARISGVVLVGESYNPPPDPD